MTEFALFTHTESELGAIFDTTLDAVAQRFVDRGISLTPRCLDQTTAVNRTSVVALITKDHSLSADQIREYPSCRLISLAYTGYRDADTAYCLDNGIAIYCVPDYSSLEVGELAFYHALCGVRLPVDPRYDDWIEGPIGGDLLQGKTIGVVGMGATGQAAADCFDRFGCHVIGWNRSRRPDLDKLPWEMRVGSDALDSVVREANVLTLHVASNPDTDGLFDARRLSLMPRNAVLVNTARADLVDQQALVTALNSGDIRAGLDVFETEPTRADDPILVAPRTYLTTHIGWKTNPATERMLDEAIRNVGRGLVNDPMNRIERSAG